METITGSTATILAAECQSAKALSSLITNAASIRSEISFPQQSSKTTRANLSHASILGRKTVRFSLPLSKSDDQAWMGSENVESDIDLGPSRVLRIKFQLQKKCHFGERFLLVGDDPVLGSWNPTNAIPLNWSDHDIWTTDVLEIPIGKCFLYKFLLKTKKGDIVWQPGPNKVFGSWMTTKILITIREDWENAQAQKIISEQEIMDPINELPTEEQADETTSYDKVKLKIYVEAQPPSLENLLNDTREKLNVEEQKTEGKKNAKTQERRSEGDVEAQAPSMEKHNVEEPKTEGKENAKTQERRSEGDVEAQAPSMENRSNDTQEKHNVEERKNEDKENA